MGRAENAKKSIEFAAYMKKMGITRKTGACPWGCGTSIRNGGEHLLTHLNICTGKRRC